MSSELLDLEQRQSHWEWASRLIPCSFGRNASIGALEVAATAKTNNNTHNFLSHSCALKNPALKTPMNGMKLGGRGRITAITAIPKAQGNLEVLLALPVFS